MTALYCKHAGGPLRVPVAGWWPVFHVTVVLEHTVWLTRLASLLGWYAYCRLRRMQRRAYQTCSPPWRCVNLMQTTSGSCWCRQSCSAGRQSGKQPLLQQLAGSTGTP